MRQRCTNPRSTRFDRYGGRGISVCTRWSTFEQFFEDMGECPPGMTLERIDFDSDYSPENCVWADYKAQANNKSSNHWLTLGDKRMTLAQWSEQLGVPYSCVRARRQRGWGAQESLSRPVRAVPLGLRGELLLFRGERRTLSEWSRECGIPISTLTCRLQRGWDLERALTQPPDSRRGRRAAA